MKPKQFNVEEVLDKALRLFWQHGFDGTSMQMLQDHLGLSRASIYHTFGSKNELFRQGLKQYLLMARKCYQECLTSSDDLIESLTCLLKTISEPGDNPLGCLLVLSTLEMSQHEPATQEMIRMAHAHMHATLAHKLQQAGVKEFNEKAEILCVSINGLAVMSKAGKKASEKTLHALLEFLR